MRTVGEGRTRRPISRRAAVALSVTGMVATVVVALLAARLVAGAVLGPGVFATSGNGEPCAVTTPHAEVARGDGIVAVVFLWFVRGSPGPTATPYDPDATPIEAGTRETVCILRASDGALVTHYDIGATGIEYIQNPGSLLALAPDGSELYLSTYISNSHSTRLCALAALTGAILWCQQQLGFIEQAAVDDTALYLLADGTLEALDPASGQPRWQRNGFDADQLQPFVLDGDRIFEFASDGVGRTGLCAWRTNDGSTAWCQHTASGSSIFQFSEGGGYATTISRLSNSLLVQEWRASDGQPLWQQKLTGVGDPQQTLNASGGVYLSAGNAATSSLDYLLLALDAATGAHEWTLDTHTAPVSFVKGGSGFVATQDGILLGYLPPSPASSAPAWQTRVAQGGGGGARFISTSAVYYVFGATTIGMLRVSDGKPLWEATNCADGSESAPARESNGATRWCHWPDADTGFEAAVASGSVVV